MAGRTTAAAAGPPDPPDGLLQILSLATPDERELLCTLLGRATGPLKSLADLVDLARGADELAALRGLVARAAGRYPRTRSRQGTAYERHKQRTAKRQSDLSREGREIGPLPPVRDPERKEACRRDLRLYFETYHPEAFPLAWSPDHERMILRLQIVILVGALKAYAMPRGSGKSTMAERAVMWSENYGHHQFAMLIAAKDETAEEMLAAIREDFETNQLLLEDFPEVCYPLQKLDSIYNRARGQLLDGRATRMRFKSRLLVLPSVPGSAASGGIIKTGGILSALRGAKHRLPGGRVIRPSLILIDDPQTRESAESPNQSATRERIVSADILGMGGPGQRIAAMMTVTVTSPGDMADNILDREKHPDWRGERTQLLYEWPSEEAMELWNEYDEIRRKYLKEDDEADATPKQATAFYRKHLSAMKAGARVAWEQRFRADEEDALQHAMNLWFRDPLAFSSEYQNTPCDPELDETFLTADEIAKKTSSYRRGQVPQGANWITAGIDVHKRVLYWTVCAWESDFTGYILDYGVFPKPRRQTFTAANFRPTLMEVFKGHGTEGAITAGLQALCDDLLGRRWQRDDGTELPISRCLIDAGWDTNTVRKFIRAHNLRAVLMPSFGRTNGPNEIAISQYRQRPGEQIGEEWLIRRGRGRTGQHVLYDTYAWKTFFHRRLATPAGDSGALSLFGREDGEKRAQHATFARHLDAERRERVVGRRSVDVWSRKPGTSENHWLDSTVMATVAGSIVGARAGAAAAPVKRVRKSLGEVAAASRKRAA